MVVFAVDEGILQVARYRAPDPLGYFFAKRALQVQTTQILDLALPEFKRFIAAASPGGDAEGALGRHLNPFKRQRDKPVAYWSGVIDAGPRECGLSWQVPDTFNGTLRVMAVAVSVSGDAVGVFEKRIVSRGDLTLSPNAPLTVTPGDEFDVSVGVANNAAGSGAAAELTVTLASSPHFEVVGASTAKLAVAESHENATGFRVRVKDELGSGTLNFSANLGARGAQATVAVSVRPPQPYFVQLSAGTIRGGEADAPLSRTLYPEHRSLHAGVSFMPLALTHGLVTYLENFPHSCTEQLVSMAVPALILSDRPEFGYVKSKDNRSLDDAITALRERQNSEGAVGMWAANAHISEHASVYAMHFLVEAKERKRAVPQAVIDAGNKWLQNLAGSPGASLAEERAGAYAVYILTRQGIVTANLAAAIQKRLEEKHAGAYEQDIAAAYLAASYRLMKQEALAERLISPMEIGRSTPYAVYNDPMARDAALLFLLARHFPERLPRLKPDALESLVKPVAAGQYNTYSSAWTILALDAYARVVEKLPPNSLAVSEVLRNGAVRPLTLPPALMPRVSLDADMAGPRFANKSSLNAYWFVEEAGFDRELPEKEIRDGIEVLREYVDVAGKPVSTVRLGAEIEVRLKFRAIGRSAVENVALVDLLPGGFDLVLNETGVARFGRSNWRPDFADRRDDRIVLYGTVSDTFQEFVYRIKATNSGAFTVPPAYSESMYERGVRARSLGARITVVKP
jgi:uncharacterized protein YfaS (alpha-2-macroglobulin family)